MDGLTEIERAYINNIPHEEQDKGTNVDIIIDEQIIEEEHNVDLFANKHIMLKDCAVCTNIRLKMLHEVFSCPTCGKTHAFIPFLGYTEISKIK